MIEASPGVFRAKASAKINLYLHVTGRRSDGYHLLDSLIVFAGVGDTIEIRPSDRLDLIIDGPFAADIPPGPENLTFKAAETLARTAGVAALAEIRLTKCLPVAAGIGGGSADAAATLKALSSLWNIALPAETLTEVALALGADLPVCLAGHPAYIDGIGEEVTMASPLPPCWLVLANPRVALPTSTVFQRREGAFSKADRLTEEPDDASTLAKLLAKRRNDLTTAAVALEPVVDAVLWELDRLPGALLSRMSGSGATCFSLFANRNEAEAGAQLLGQQRRGWWVAAAPVLS